MFSAGLLIVDGRPCLRSRMFSSRPGLTWSFLGLGNYIQSGPPDPVLHSVANMGERLTGIGYVKALESMKQGIKLESAKCDAARFSGICSFGSRVQCGVRDEPLQFPEKILSSLTALVFNKICAGVSPTFFLPFQRVTLPVLAFCGPTFKMLRAPTPQSELAAVRQRLRALQKQACKSQQKQNLLCSS